MAVGGRVARLAEKLRLPGGQQLAGRISGIVGGQLDQPPALFERGQSALGADAVGRLQGLMEGIGSNAAGIDQSRLAFATNRKIPVQQVQLSKQEQLRRNRLGEMLTQKTRDGLARRGINNTAAGAAIEAQTIGRFYEDLAANDFAKNRALTQEAMANEQVRQQSEARLFGQQLQAEATRQGRETELFQRQLMVVDRALSQSNVQFDQSQREFATNLTAAGLPIGRALQFLALAQKGDMAAADMELQGIGIDMQARNSLLDVVGNIFGGVTQAAGVVAGAKLFGGA